MEQQPHFTNRHESLHADAILDILFKIKEGTLPSISKIPFGPSGGNIYFVKVEQHQVKDLTKDGHRWKHQGKQCLCVF